MQNKSKTSAERNFAKSDSWSLAEEMQSAAMRQVMLSMTATDWAALSRVALSQWTPDAQVARLQELGLAECVFGQPLLTRLGRATLGVQG